MDPDEVLQRAREAARLYTAQIDALPFDESAGAYANTSPGVNEVLEQGDVLAEALLALDNWLCNGGFLPASWIMS